jgi:SAM-dependent methyltransferase
MDLSDTATPISPNQALWEKGDFCAIAAFMRESGADFVAALGVHPPLRALDLGCGDGTTAVPLAQAGADVTGIDISRNLLAAARQRAAAAGLDRLRFQHGDACCLTAVPDHSFDLTLSVFGAMFAPRPLDVAKEMVRVTRPGGRVVMGNWIPNDPTFVSELLRISSAFTPPPPPEFLSPMLWGVESHVRERFGAAGVAPDRIAFTRETFRFLSADKSPADFIGLFETYYGPTMNAVAAARAQGREQDLHRQLVDLANAHNRAGNGGTDISATYLKVAVSL